MSDYIMYIAQKELFTVPEAANFLTVSTRTVYELIKNNQLKCVVLGSRYKIEASELRRYIDTLKHK